MKRAKVGKSVWHVFTRGPRRLVLFNDDQDFLKFLSILAYALGASGAGLWGYALMPNHYHLMIYATSEELTACLRRLNHMYSVHYNRRYRQLGHSYDGPYHAYRQRGLFFILKRLAYIFLNPVVGGLATRPEDYRWSSYRSYLGITGSALDVDPTPVYTLLSGRPGEKLSIFLKAMEKEAARPQRKAAGVPAAVSVQADQFEWLLEYARTQSALLEGEDPLTVAIYWAKQSGVPPRAMALALGDPNSGRVRAALHRFEAKLKANPGLAERLPLP